MAVTAPEVPTAALRRSQALRAQRFPVRIGELARSDDALLGFFLDDDYAHLACVDKVVAALARDPAGTPGILGLLGSTTCPAVAPLAPPVPRPGGHAVLLRPGDVRS